MKTKLIKTDLYLLLVDEEAEIANGDIICYPTIKNTIPVKYLGGDLTNEKLIIAYKKLNEEAKELDLPELPSFEKEIDVEELAEVSSEKHHYAFGQQSEFYQLGFIEGYKAAQAKQFSLEDMKDILEEGLNWFGGGRDKEIRDSETWFNHYIQSISTQKLPSEFIPEYEYYYHSSKEFYSDAKFEKCSKEQYDSIKEEIPTCPTKVELKTIINSEGKEELVGVYKY